MAKLLKLFIKGVIIILPQPNRRLAAGAVPSSQGEERYDGVATIEGECPMVFCKYIGFWCIAILP